MRSELNLNDLRSEPGMREDEWVYRFSSKLDKMMRANNVKNAELAKAVGIGQSTISCYRRGVQIPNAYVTALICKALGCTVSALMDF